MDHTRPEFLLFSAKAANAKSDTINVKGFKYITIALFGATGADMDVLLRGSAKETAPDLTAAASASNLWSYIGMQDQGALTDIVGSTGYEFNGTGGAATLRANVDALNWIALEIANWVAAGLTAYVMLSNDKNDVS